MLLFFFSSLLQIHKEPMKLIAAKTELCQMFVPNQMLLKYTVKDGYTQN